MDASSEDDLFADPEVTELELGASNEDLSYFTAVSRSLEDEEDDDNALSPMAERTTYLFRPVDDEKPKRLLASFEEEEFSDIQMPEDFTLFITDTFTASQPSPHTVYTVEIVAGKQRFRIFQRFSEFYKFDQQLRKEVDKQERSDLPPLPELPPKDFVNKNDPAFIERRKIQLERYLRLLVVHPYISRGKGAREIAEKMLSILPGSVQSHLAYKLLKDLKLAIQVILNKTAGNPDVVIEDGDPAFRVCFLIEKILHHGLKGGQSIFNRKTFWRYVIYLKKCLKEKQVQEHLQLAQEMGNNNLARARVFLRLALNDHALSHYLVTLSKQKSHLQQCYEDYAVLRNEEHSSAFILLLQMLDGTQFTLWIKDKNMGELTYYNQILLKQTEPKSPAIVREIKPQQKRMSSRESSEILLQSAEPFISPSQPAGSRLTRRSLSIEGKDNAALDSPSVGEQLTASLWSIVCISLVKEEKREGVYQSLVAQNSPFEAQIESDIHRVLTTVRFESGDGPKLLHNILKAFSLYKPELGYSQELSFVCAILLLQLEEEGAFWVLCWLSKKYSYENEHLFSQDPTLLKHCLFILEQLLEKKIPDLGRHMSSIGINTSFFASEWFSTLFTYGFPMATTFRIWDVLILEDKEYIFKICLAMVFLAKEKLMSTQSMEDVVKYMKKEMPHFLDVDRVLKVAEEISIPNDVFSFYSSSFLAANSTNPFVESM